MEIDSATKRVFLKPLVDALVARLVKVIPSEETRSINVGSKPDDTAYMLSFIKEDTPTGDNPNFPWDTRYVFIYVTQENGPLQMHAYFFDGPYDSKTQSNKIHLQAFYNKTEEDQNALFHHASEHLIMGTNPINMASSTFQ